MRINPGYRVISLADGRVRIGSGAGGLWVEGLGPAEVDFVLSLAGPAFGPAPGGEATTGDGLDPCRRAAIIDLLRPVLVDQAAYRIPGSRSGVLAPDIRQWSAAYGRHAGPLVVRRGRTTVRIHGLDRAGQELARLLASAGIGTLQLCDPQPVGLGDLSTGLLKVPDLGRSRAGASAVHLRRLAPHLRVQEIRAQQWMRPGSSGPEPDVAVVFARERIPVEIQAGFASAQAPHLRVLFGDAGASVGPLVLPGSTACLDCPSDAQDPDDPSPQPPASEPETALAAAVAGLAAVQILMLLDGVNVPAAVDGILHLDLATGGVVREVITPRPGCLCRALAA